MDVIGVIQFVAALLIILGAVLIILGLLPPTRPRFQDFLGWGVVLVVVGLVALFALLLAGVLAG